MRWYVVAEIAKVLAFLALLFAGGALVFWADDLAVYLEQQERSER